MHTPVARSRLEKGSDQIAVALLSGPLGTRADAVTHTHTHTEDARGWWEFDYFNLIKNYDTQYKHWTAHDNGTQSTSECGECTIIRNSERNQNQNERKYARGGRGTGAVARDASSPRECATGSSGAARADRRALLREFNLVDPKLVHSYVYIQIWSQCTRT